MTTSVPETMASSPTIISRVWNSSYTFWALLALPSLPTLASLGAGELRGVLHPSGEFAARFTILALAITPLMMLAPQARLFRWLMARRRAIGVAAFAYSALHLVAYVMKEGSLAKILGEMAHPGLLTGWIAFAIFAVLAVTSNDRSVRFLKRGWKSVQRLVYPAALLIIAHWALVSHGPGGLITHFAPLAALELYRIGRNMKWWNFRFARHQSVAIAR